jgi:hypothetical protein|tara:strand:- start:239 stop:487 length:249 start_codon:yes stop_codon:yes gene_type:complete
MQCPICQESHIKECDCILERHNDIIRSKGKINKNQLIEKVEELMELNSLLIESSTQAFDAKFYIGRRTGMNIIKELITQKLK